MFQALQETCNGPPSQKQINKRSELISAWKINNWFLVPSAQSTMVVTIWNRMRPTEITTTLLWFYVQELYTLFLLIRTTWLLQVPVGNKSLITSSKSCWFWYLTTHTAQTVHVSVPLVPSTLPQTFTLQLSHWFQKEKREKKQNK